RLDPLHHRAETTGSRLHNPSASWSRCMCSSSAGRIARGAAGGGEFYFEQVPILTSSVRSSPPLAITPRTNPTFGAKYLDSTTPGSNRLVSVVTRTSRYFLPRTVTDSPRLTTFAWSSATLRANSW